MQQDCQEFCRILIDCLDLKSKGTPMQGQIEKCFEGRIEQYVNCLEVNYRSQRVETFLDLALNVKNCSTLAKSFEVYIEKEILEGDNAYRAEGFAEKQKAEKGSIFLRFPPMLQLQLKRFEYDYTRDIMMKINDRFEFPLSIDLSPYMAKEAVERDMKNNDPPVYHLHSVLVHSGSVGSGHYYCKLIFPNQLTRIRFMNS